MKSLIILSLILVLTLGSTEVKRLETSAVQELFYNNNLIKCITETYESYNAITTLISDIKNHNSTIPNEITEISLTYNKIVMNLVDCGLIKSAIPPIIPNPSQVQYCLNDVGDLLSALKQFPGLFKPSTFNMQYILHVVQGMGMVFDYVLNDCYLFQPSYKN